MLDYSGNGNNGTTSARVTGLTWAGRKNGIIGNACMFGGVSGKISIASGATLTTKSARTVSFWLKSTQTTGVGPLVTFEPTSNVGTYVSDSKQRSWLGSHNLRQWADVSAIALGGQWHHWCYTIVGVEQNDIDNAVLRIDNNIIGVLATQKTTTAGYDWLGHSVGGASGFINGSIDEVMIWNRVLTDDEITDLYELDIFIGRTKSNNAIWFGVNF